MTLLCDEVSDAAREIIRLSQVKSELCVFHYFFFLVETGEDKRIKEFYQSRGLERVIQPAGDGKWLPSLSLTSNVFN